MDRHSEFFEFVMLIFIDGDDATVAASSRALDQIRLNNLGNTTAHSHHTEEHDSPYKAFAGSRS